jgi:acetyl-CoA carboxylase biotin carboxyl carrier protein
VGLFQRRLKRGLEHGSVSEENKKSQPGPFDYQTVRHLVRLMKKFDLSEVDLQDGQQRLKLRRGARLVAAPALATMAPLAPAMAAPATVAQPAAPAGAAPAAAGAPAGKKLLEIKSPMVGTFYSKPAPDKDEYVKVGSKVTADTVVCKVEAMKIFNDLTAGVSGVITEVLASNGGFVEYDQVLFRVDPG